MQCALCGEKGTSFLGRRQYSLCCAKLVVQGGPLARGPRLVAHAPQVYNLEDYKDGNDHEGAKREKHSWCYGCGQDWASKDPNLSGGGFGSSQRGRLWQNSEHGIPKGEVVHVFEFGRIFDHGTQRGETLPGCWPQGRSALSTF